MIVVTAVEKTRHGWNVFNVGELGRRFNRFADKINITQQPRSMTDVAEMKYLEGTVNRTVVQLTVT